MKNKSDKHVIHVETGLYRHYKGAEYEVLGTCQHSETEDVLVVYRALYGEFGLWVRPISMFNETVELEGEHVQRFSLTKAYNVHLGKNELGINL